MLSIVLGLRRLYNAMTQSLAGKQRDTQLDCICCSCVFGLDWNMTPPPFPFFPHVQFYSTFPGLDVQFSSHFYSNSTCFHSLLLPLCLFLLFHSIYLSLRLVLPSSLSPPTLSLTECCGASAAGSLPIRYITVPSASLNHCWAKLVAARIHILPSNLWNRPAEKRLSVWDHTALAFLISEGKLIIFGSYRAEQSI